MEDLLEIILEEILNNKKISKILKCIVVFILEGFVAFITLKVAGNSDTLSGQIVCWVIVVLLLLLYIQYVVGTIKNK